MPQQLADCCPVGSAPKHLPGQRVTYPVRPELATRWSLVRSLSPCSVASWIKAVSLTDWPRDSP